MSDNDDSDSAAPHVSSQQKQDVGRGLVVGQRLCVAVRTAAATDHRQFSYRARGDNGGGGGHDEIGLSGRDLHYVTTDYAGAMRGEQLNTAVERQRTSCTAVPVLSPAGRPPPLGQHTALAEGKLNRYQPEPVL